MKNRMPIPLEPSKIDLTGTTIGRYHLEALISGGLWTATYRATAAGDSRPVAVQIVFAGFAPDATFASRFARLSRALLALRHPRIVTVRDAGTCAYGYFFVTDLPAGETIAARMGQGRLSPPEIQSIIDDLAAALDALQAAQVEWVRLTPNDIVLTPDGGAMIANLGVMLFAAETPALRLAYAAEMPYYIAPEWLTGEPPSRAADIYGLGVLLFEMIAGTPPYVDASPLGVWQKHLSAPVPNIQDFAPDVPDTVKSLLAQMLAKSPAERPLDAGMVAQTLRQVWQTDGDAPANAAPLNTGTVILPPAFSASPKDPRPRRNLRWMIIPVLVALVAIGAATGLRLRLAGGVAQITALPTATATPTATPQPTERPSTATAAIAVAPTPTVPPVTSTPAPSPTATPTPTASPTVLPSVTPTNSDLLAALRGKILFKTNRNGRVEIFQMDTDGSNQQPLPVDRIFLYNDAVRWEAFSPSHGQTVVVRGSGQFDLWLVDLAAGTEKRLTSHPAADYDPVWSPAGNRVVFVSERTGNGDLYLYDVATGRMIRLTDDVATFDKHPSWSPDGAALVFWSNRGGINQPQIWRLDLSGGEIRNLSQNEFEDWDPVWVK